MENKTNEFEGKEILKSDEAARLLGITVNVCVVQPCTYFQITD